MTKFRRTTPYFQDNPVTPILATVTEIIDTHQHVFWHGKDDAGLINDMDANGISSAWLLTWEIPPYCDHDSVRQKAAKLLNPAHIRPDGSHPGLIFEDILVAHHNYPGRFVLGYCPDPLQPQAAAIFEAACEMYGVRVCGEWKFCLPFDDPRNIELFRVAGKRNAPVVLHLDVPYLPPSGGRYIPVWYGGSIANLERALQLCPETNFIGHGPGFWRELYDDADTRVEVRPDGSGAKKGRIFDLLVRHPNLYADLSASSGLVALNRNIALTKELFEQFRFRLLFGRDSYGNDLRIFLDSLELPLSTTEAIYFRNALRLVPLQPNNPIL